MLSAGGIAVDFGFLNHVRAVGTGHGDLLASIQRDEYHVQAFTWLGGPMHGKAKCVKLGMVTLSSQNLLRTVHHCSGSGLVC